MSRGGIVVAHSDYMCYNNNYPHDAKESPCLRMRGGPVRQGPATSFHPWRGLRRGWAEGFRCLAQSEQSWTRGRTDSGSSVDDALNFLIVMIVVD